MRALVLALIVVWVSAGAGNAELPVEIARVREVAQYPEGAATATVVSLNETVLGAELRAVVTEILVRVGDVASPGQPLVRLDCADYRAALREAEGRERGVAARERYATLRLQRAEELLDRESVSREIFDEREAELDALRGDRSAAAGRLQKARLDVSRCAIASPFRALITERRAALGQYVAPGDPLLGVLDLDQIEVSAQIPVGDAVAVGGAAELVFEHAGERHPVLLRALLPAVATATRTREARLTFSGNAPLPGAAGKLRWRDARPHAPPELVVERGGVLGVFVAEDGAARFVGIPAAEAGRATPLPLELDDHLVVRGHLGLREGERVSAR